MQLADRRPIDPPRKFIKDICRISKIHLICTDSHRSVESNRFQAAISRKKVCINFLLYVITLTQQIT